MDVGLFGRCIQYITSRYQVVLLEDWVLSGEKQAAAKLATISFDDGYWDNLEYAAPILEKYHCPASFYVVTDCIEHNRLTWTHTLEHAFLHTHKDQVAMYFDFLPGPLQTESLPGRRAKMDYVRRLLPFLRRCSHTQRMQVVEHVQRMFADVRYPELMMSWHDLLQLKNAGHYIGSHTVSHAVLSTMEDRAQVQRELRQSGRAIEEALGYFPCSVSYPLGKYNEQVVAEAQKAGYQVGLAVGQQVYDPSVQGVFEIPRIELYNEPWWKTWLRMTHRLEKLKRLVGYKATP